MRRIFFIISMISLLPLLLHNGYIFIEAHQEQFELSGNAQGVEAKNSEKKVESVTSISSLLISSDGENGEESTGQETDNRSPEDEETSRSTYRKIVTDEKVVALTFDDGPDARYTGQVLDILKDNQTKATFFVIGRMAERYPDVLKRIVKEGHSLGNHTWDHMNLTKVSEDELINQLEKTSQFVHETTDYAIELVRPPYGSVNEQTASTIYKMGYDIINWSVDTRDWDGTSSSAIVSEVESETRPGAVILLHSAGGRGGNLDNTIKALPSIIESLQRNGYRFVTIPELLDVKE